MVGGIPGYICLPVYPGRCVPACTCLPVHAVAIARDAGSARNNTFSRGVEEERHLEEGFLPFSPQE